MNKEFKAIIKRQKYLRKEDYIKYLERELKLYIDYKNNLHKLVNKYLKK